MTDPHVIPLGQEDNLNQIVDLLEPALDALPGDQAGLALIAAGLDLLPAGRCRGHLRKTLLDVRAEVDRLLAALEEKAH